MTTENYTAVSLFTIPPDEPLPFAVSVYWQGQFVLYRKAGQSFEVSKYNRFIFKRISKLYIAAEELKSYQNFVRRREAIENEKLEDPNLTVEQRETYRTVRSLDNITKQLFIASDEELGETTTKVIGVAKDTVERICERPYLRVFEAIPTGSIVDHSMRVSLLATFLGYQLGFVNPIALENLAAAGLLHDVGKTRVALPESLEMTAEQDEEVFKMHPILSVAALRKFPLVPEEVVNIVMEHHERRDGTGFPNGIRGRQMHGLTKVFNIANTFDRLMSEVKGDRETRCKLAAAKMEKEMRSWFDPMLMPKALRLLINPAG